MGEHGFSQLRPYPSESEDAMIPRQCRRSFSRFELCLLVPLTVFAIALAAFSIVYIFQHQGTVKPAAIAALGCTGLILVSVVFVVVRRLRRPDWYRDLESAAPRKWQISAPMPAPPQQMRQTTLDSEVSYTPLPNQHQQPSSRPTIGGKIRLAVKRTFSPSLLSRSSFESSTTTTQQDGQDRLLRGNDRWWGDSTEDRSSMESSEDGEGLWTSVFELAGDSRLEQLRQANLKRLSRESRRSRYEMNASGVPASALNNEGVSAVKIVVTKPEPAASPPRSRRGSSNNVRGREVSLSFDPLRSNPFQLQRELSVRQIKSSQDLTKLSRDRSTDPVIRRPRSAEPALDRSLLGHELVRVRHQHLSPNPSPGKILPVAPRQSPSPSPSIAVQVASKNTTAGRTPRGLRRLPSPNEGGEEGRDLRTVFKNGVRYEEVNAS